MHSAGSACPQCDATFTRVRLLIALTADSLIFIFPQTDALRRHQKSRLAYLPKFHPEHNSNLLADIMGSSSSQLSSRRIKTMGMKQDHRVQRLVVAAPHRWSRAKGKVGERKTQKTLLLWPIQARPAPLIVVPRATIVNTPWGIYKMVRMTFTSTNV